MGRVLSRSGRCGTGNARRGRRRNGEVGDNVYAKDDEVRNGEERMECISSKAGGFSSTDCGCRK